MVHHRRGLRLLLRDDELLARIEANWRDAGLEGRRLAMLSYVERLTLAPSSVSQNDVAALRQAGFSDPDVLAIAEVTAYYAYVNRVADGLGVTVEPWVADEENAQAK